MYDIVTGNRSSGCDDVHSSESVRDITQHGRYPPFADNELFSSELSRPARPLISQAYPDFLVLH